jgi:hypothetical protein
MANTFIRKIHREIDNTATDGGTKVGAYSPSGTGIKATVIGLSVANTSTASVDVDVLLRASSTNYYLIKSGPLPSGSSLVCVGGDQKLVLEENDEIRVKSSSATNKVDVIMSLLEIT